jgi:hypothetical protein
MILYSDIVPVVLTYSGSIFCFKFEANPNECTCVNAFFSTESTDDALFTVFSCILYIAYIAHDSLPTESQITCI